MYYWTPFLVSSDVNPGSAVLDEVVTVWQEKGLNGRSFQGPTDCRARRDRCDDAACAPRCWTSPHHPCDSRLCKSTAFQKAPCFDLRSSRMGISPFVKLEWVTQSLTSTPHLPGSSAKSAWELGHLHFGTEHTWSWCNFCWLAFASIYPQKCYEATICLCRRGIFCVMNTCKLKQ